jgi:hypothetical protein
MPYVSCWAAVFGLLASPGDAAAGKPIVHIDLSGSDAPGAADGSAARPFRSVAGWLASAAQPSSSSSPPRFPHQPQAALPPVGASLGVGGIDFGPGVHDLVAAGGLVLAAAGTADAPFTVRGAGEAVTTLTAGVPVTGFVELNGATGETFSAKTMQKTGGVGIAMKRTASSIPAAQQRQWRATLPPNTTYFRQLFVRNGTTAPGDYERRLTARSPTMAYDHADASNPQFAIVCVQAMRDLRRRGAVVLSLFSVFVVS